MTKADQIIAFVRKYPGISLAVVAGRVGCHPAYVRTAMHRAGIFRRKHDPDVVYLPNKGAERRRQEREALAAKAEQLAQAFEHQAAACSMRQARSVPEPQLSQLKATHWRILAKWIRETPAAQLLSSGKQPP